MHRRVPTPVDERVRRASGEFFDFESVAFEPSRSASFAMAVGGESHAAMRRAASLDGWMGLMHTPESAAPVARNTARSRRRCERAPLAMFRYPANAATKTTSSDGIAAGGDRLIVAVGPSRNALDGHAHSPRAYSTLISNPRVSHPHRALDS